MFLHAFHILFQRFDFQDQCLIFLSEQLLGAANGRYSIASVHSPTQLIPPRILKRCLGGIALVFIAVLAALGAKGHSVHFTRESLKILKQTTRSGPIKKKNG